MPVVFDEVIASVEAPAPEKSTDAPAMQSPIRSDEDKKVLVAIETQQRREQRLEAN